MCTHDLPSELNHFPISRAQAVELADIFRSQALCPQMGGAMEISSIFTPQPFSDEETEGPIEQVPSPRLSSSDRAHVQACIELH